MRHYGFTCWMRWCRIGRWRMLGYNIELTAFPTNCTFRDVHKVQSCGIATTCNTAFCRWVSGVHPHICILRYVRLSWCRLSKFCFCLSLKCLSWSLNASTYDDTAEYPWCHQCSFCSIPACRASGITILPARKCNPSPMVSSSRTSQYGLVHGSTECLSGCEIACAEQQCL
jgi:hypothetical protein